MSRIRTPIAALLLAASGAALALPYAESGDAGSTPGSAQAVADGTDVITGALGVAGDVDIYRLEFTTGGSVTFWAGSSPAIDDNLILIDGSGQPVYGDDDGASGGDGLDSEIVWTVSPGTYYLAYGDNNIYAYNASDIVICGNDDGDCSAGTDVVSYVQGGTDTGGYTITLSTPTGPVAPRAPQAIPTLSEWGMILLSGLLALGAFFTLRRRSLAT